MSGKKTISQYDRLVDLLRHIILTNDEHIGIRYSISVVPPLEEEETNLYLIVRIDEGEKKTLCPVYCDEDIEEAIDVFIRLEGEYVSIRRESLEEEIAAAGDEE